MHRADLGDAGAEQPVGIASGYSPGINLLQPDDLSIDPAHRDRDKPSVPVFSVPDAMTRDALPFEVGVSSCLG